MELEPHSSARPLADAHLHLDPAMGGSAADAVQDLLAGMRQAGVARAHVLHLMHHPWDASEVAKALAPHPQLVGFVHVDPGAPGARASLSEARSLGFRGVKLHPRLQRFNPSGEACIALAREAGRLGMPLVIDCFPDGDWLMAGLQVLDYARLAKEAPQARIIVAHAAGHHCLDLLMLMKRVPNLWLDISYSLLYYQGPVVDNLLYCLRSLRCRRCLFGTDYPDRSLPLSVEGMLALLDRAMLENEPRENLLWNNSQTLFETLG